MPRPANGAEALVGKIGIPDYILLKAVDLNADEFEIMKTHTTIGARILAESRSEILQVARQIALSHHEKWDGSGYPRGLSGEAIPLAGRIVALADVFDAILSPRPYKDPFPIDSAIEIVKGERGKHFDPKLVDIFTENIDDYIGVWEGKPAAAT